ncbi:unnamed protein product [Meloidogyne enterolobii]|uniref:Uncharacterized protein n=1 Tax=Meloidogyne enterolobii TaxID=390850 RepID=A0ACB0Z8V5_MELEN
MDLQNIRENSGRPFLVNDTDGYHDVILNEKTIIRVLKRYTDFYIIGLGAQGVVMSALDVVTNERVAIKKLTRPFSNPTHAKRAYREFEIMNLMDHPNMLCGINYLHKASIVHRLIGSGAQGVVMSALDVVTNERVAIKKLTRPFSNPTHAKRAYREFEIMNLMDHPNIIRLLNAFTPQNSLEEFDDLYLVMELMNASLCQVTAMDLDHERLSFLLYQMLCGINYLHKASIVHRDIKPSNIVVNYQCRLKILDFGIKNFEAFNKIFFIGLARNVEDENIVFFPGNDYIDQWTKIVDGLGSPDNDFTKLLTPEVRNYILKLPYVATRDWKEIFPDSIFPKNINDRLNAENARDLISRMLVLNPLQRFNIFFIRNNFDIKILRITVSDALKFPYVSLVFDGPPPPPYIDPDHSPDLSLEQWRELLFKQIKDYENTHDIFGIQSNPVPNEMSEDENS